MAAGAEEFDVVVVGAGPAGGYAAGAIAKAGYEVALLEEHREVGEPIQFFTFDLETIHCTG